MLGKTGILIVIFVLLLVFYFVISWGAGKKKQSGVVAGKRCRRCTTEWGGDHAAGGTSRLPTAAERGCRDQRSGPCQCDLLFAQSVRAFDPSVPGCLPLLHLRSCTQKGAGTVPAAGRGAKDRHSGR